MESREGKRARLRPIFPPTRKAIKELALASAIRAFSIRKGDFSRAMHLILQGCNLVFIFPR